MLVGVGVGGGAAAAAAPTPTSAAATALLCTWWGQAAASGGQASRGPRGPPEAGAGTSDALPGLQMGACSTVAVDVRMDFSRSRSRSRSRSLSDAEVAEGFVK